MPRNLFEEPRTFAMAPNSSVPHDGKDHTTTTTTPVSHVSLNSHSGETQSASRGLKARSKGQCSTKQSLQNVWDQERRTQDEELLKILRRRPSEAHTPLASGIFVLPVHQIHLFDIRAQASKLDHIRRQYRCYLFYDQTLACFRIFSYPGQYSYQRVSDATDALKVMMCESIASSTKQLRLYLVKPPQCDESLLGIRMLPIEQLDSSMSAACTSVIRKSDVVAQLVPLEVANGGNDTMRAFEAGPSVLGKKNTLAMATATSRSLERLQYRHGRIRFRALLGIFAFSRYLTGRGKGDRLLPGVERASEFIINLRSSKTGGALHRLTARSQLLERVYRCGDLLELDDDNSQGNRSLHTYHTGVFTFAATTPSDPVSIQLMYHTSSNIGLEACMPRSSKQEWTTTDDTFSVRCLELFVATLGLGMSWKLEIAAQRCDRSIPQNLQAFAQSVKILQPTPGCSVHEGNAELMFDISSSSLRPQDFVQRTSWRFRLKVNPDYVLEVSRLDRFDTTTNAGRHQSSARLEPIQRTPCSTEWEACIFHTRWDEYFGQNLSLRTGQRANWQPSLDTFFPKHTTGETCQSPNTGFEQFVELVHAVADRVGAVEL